MSVRIKIIALLSLIALISCGLILGLFVYKSDGFHRDAMDRMTDYAVLLNETVDRNLFERYGDVQAFGQNRAAYDSENWGRPDEANPLVSAINSYITNYGIYKISMLVSNEGRVLAVNTRDSKNKPIKTDWLYGQSFASAAWFKSAKEGKFLEGTNGLTGTAVVGPIKDEAVAKIFESDGLVIAFSAPVKNEAGNSIGVWVNLADFSLVEQIIASFYGRLKNNGLDQAEITLLDNAGMVLVDYDPYVQGEFKRDYDIVGRRNLVQDGVTAAMKAIESKGSGALYSMNPQKGIEQVAAFNYSAGAYDYPGLGWVLMLRAPKDQVFASLNGSIQDMLLSSIAVVVVMVVMAVLLGGMIVRLLVQFVQTMEKMSAGDTDFVIAGQDGKDEVGRLMRAAENLRKSVEEAFRLKQMVEDMPSQVITVDVRDDFKINYMNNTSRKMLAGLQDHLPVPVDQMMGKSFDIFHKNPSHQRNMLSDSSRLPHRAKIKVGPEHMDLLISAIKNPKGDYVGAMLTWTLVTKQVEMADLFERSVKGIVNSVASAATELAQTSQELVRIMGDTAHVVQGASTGAVQTSSNVQSVASASEEMTASVREISSQLQQSNNMVQESVKRAESADVQAASLSEATDKVKQVISLISEIAGQINLLALNATIESARAGDAGKGFAVVASEVKNLANQTNKSVDEITRVIEEMNLASSDIVGSLRGIKDSVQNISGSTATIAAAVEEQSATTNEIARNMQSAAQGTSAISSNLSEVTQSTAQAESAAEQVSIASRELSSQAERLNAEVNNFLNMLRTA